MTNEEWLKSLPTEEFAKNIVNIRNIVPPQYFFGYASATYGVTIWLKQEKEKKEAKE